VLVDVPTDELRTKEVAGYRSVWQRRPVPGPANLRLRELARPRPRMGTGAMR
jgi:hypothetical protein